MLSEPATAAGRCTCDPDSYEPHAPGCGIGSRFSPDEATLREMVIAANERAERLALRIVAAEHAVKNGQSSTVVLAILGSDD